jgi:hypothetical protein
MNKLINFIESEWSRPAIVCFTIFLMFFFYGCLSIAEKREANRIEAQRQAWIKQGYYSEGSQRANQGFPID